MGVTNILPSKFIYKSILLCNLNFFLLYVQGVQSGSLKSYFFSPAKLATHDQQRAYCRYTLNLYVNVLWPATLVIDPSISALLSESKEFSNDTGSTLALLLESLNCVAFIGVVLTCFLTTFAVLASCECKNLAFSSLLLRLPLGSFSLLDALQLYLWLYLFPQTLQPGHSLFSNTLGNSNFPEHQ